MRFIGWILAELPRAVVGYARLEQVFARARHRAPRGATRAAARTDRSGSTSRRVHVQLRRHAGPRRRLACGSSREESVAIVGPTGVGKSTLAQLLVRLDDPDDGDGADRRRRPPPRRPGVAPRRVAIVFQESFLFATTVGENIALDSGADRRTVERAARIAAVDRFVGAAARTGYDTVVGERGYTLSGGERQRVALARALVREPRVLILDDATSSVDPTVEAQILGGPPRGAAHDPRRGRLPALDDPAGRPRHLPGGRPRGAARASHDELLATASRLRGDHPRLRTGRTMSAARCRRTDDDEPRGPRGAPSACAVLRRGIRESPSSARGSGFTVDHLARRHGRAPRSTPVLVQLDLRPRLRRRVPARRTSARSAPSAFALVVLTFVAAPRCRHGGWSERVGAGAMMGLRVRTFAHIHRLSIAEQSEEKRGVFVARVTADVDALQQFMEWGGIAWIIVGRRRSSASLVLMLVYSWQLTLAIVVPRDPAAADRVRRCRPGSRRRSTRRGRAWARCSPRSRSP